MRLLIITFDPPENVGGIEGRAAGYTRELLAKGHSVIVASFANRHSFSEEPFYGTGLLRYPSRPRHLPSVLIRLTRRIRTTSVDRVFFLSGSITLFGVLLLLYCRASHRNSVSFYYGKDILQARQTATGRLLLSVSLNIADSIATNSRFTASLLPANVQRKCNVLYPSASFPSAYRSHTVTKDSKKRVLFVGRLVRRKGVGDLIEAFELVRKDIPGSILEIVGSGEDKERLQRLVTEKGLGDDVLFYGTLRGEALYERYRSCKVFAMPSKTLADDVEGFGTVFLEAGSFGKPSVGTLSGGIPEAVLDGVTGLLVREGDVDGLALALKEILTDEGLARRLGENARIRVVEEFSWSRGTDTLISILRG